jgi:hypothetical protein
MSEPKVAKAIVPWWVAGIILGLVQILAVWVADPLGVSTQFVILDAKAINRFAPEYTQNHPLISQPKNQAIGYGFWLDVGIVVGSLVAAIAYRRWKLQTTTVWWTVGRGGTVVGRFISGFFAGILILLGARLANGCTSGQFASGWAQLSLSAAPFTVTLFAFGMLTAWMMYPKTPDIE